MPLTADQDIADLLRSAKTIAMVGASDRPDRPSHGVMRFLLSRGYEVIPVNPQLAGQRIHGRPCSPRSRKSARRSTSSTSSATRPPLAR